MAAAVESAEQPAFDEPAVGGNVGALDELGEDDSNLRSQQELEPPPPAVAAQTSSLSATSPTATAHTLNSGSPQPGTYHTYQSMESAEATEVTQPFREPPPPPPAAALPARTAETSHERADLAAMNAISAAENAAAVSGVPAVATTSIQDFEGQQRMSVSTALADNVAALPAEQRAPSLQVPAALNEEPRTLAPMLESDQRQQRSEGIAAKEQLRDAEHAERDNAVPRDEVRNTDKLHTKEGFAVEASRGEYMAGQADTADGAAMQTQQRDDNDVAEAAAGELPPPSKVVGYFNLVRSLYYERKKMRVEMVDALRVAAESGIVSAQVKLGDKLLYGVGVGIELVNVPEGVNFHRLAANAGVVRSMIIVADCYMKGVGLDSNPDEADRLLRKFDWAKLSDPELRSQLTEMAFELGRIYFTGQIELQRNRAKSWPARPELSFEWTRIAADDGHIEAKKHLAVLYHDGIGTEANMPLAFRNWLDAAEEGDSHSSYNVGMCYYRGLGVPRDYLKAMEWIRLAAEHGDVEAHFTLGECYYDMKLYERSLAEFRAAAGADFARAQYAVGWHYYHGEGVTRSYSEAVKWFYKAADQACAEAVFFLAVCFINGNGIDQDENEGKVLMKYAEYLNPNLKTESARYIREPLDEGIEVPVQAESLGSERRRRFGGGKGKS